MANKIPAKTIFFSGLLILIFSRLIYTIFFAPALDGDSLVFVAQADNFFSYLFPKPGMPIELHIGPAQPFFIRLVFLAFGRDFLFAQLAQIILELATACLIYLTAKNIFNNRYPAAIAVFLYAIYPAAIWHSSRLYSEPLFTSLLAASVYTLIKGLSNKSLWLFFACGLFLGLATLCRPVTQGFIVFLIPAVICIFKSKRIYVKSALVVLGILLIITPWAARNYYLTNKIIPVNASSGFFMLYANSRIEDADFLGDLSYQKTDELTEEAISIEPGKKISNPAELDSLRQKMAVKLILKHPYRYVIMSLNRFVRLWFNVGYGYDPSLLAKLVMLGNFLLLITGIYAVIAFRGSWLKLAFIPLLLIIYFTLVHMFTVAVFRYVVPVIPFLLIFSGFFISQILKLTNEGHNG